MRIESILVATDLSTAEGLTVQRAWQLAETHGAAITLAYMPPAGQRAPANAGWRLANAARQLEEALPVPVRTRVMKKASLDELADAAQSSDLVVLPHRHERTTAAFFRGQPVVRLLRWTGTPVLVTRGMRAPHYRRILVALDFSAGSDALVDLAARLEPRAELELFHAVDARKERHRRNAEATEQVARHLREHCLDQARQRMVRLTDAFSARRNRVRSTVGRGDPGRQTVIQQEHSGADLVVLGKPRASAWEDFLGASVAHRVLSWATSDVLVLPRSRERADGRVHAAAVSRRWPEPVGAMHGSLLPRECVPAGKLP